MTGADLSGEARHGAVQPDATSREIYDGGMVVRREVLGAEHVDRIQRSSPVTGPQKNRPQQSAPQPSGPDLSSPARNGVVQPEATSQEIYEGGMVVRREVLGAEHVDRANANKDSFTEDFQDMITRIAWGGIWTRPGLSRQMRSAVTLTAMVAHGHWEELAMHIRAALNNGLSRDEIKEILLQTAIYCGVPSANTAFKTAQQVFQSMDTPARDTTEVDTGSDKTP